MQMDPVISLELFGVDRSYRYQLVRQKLIAALESTGAHYEISDVSQIDKFIEAGLQSVPSIRVDHDKMFNIRLDEDPEVILQSVFEYIVRHKMHSIVVPTDFSDHSLNALDYAGGMAGVLGLRIELLHVYHPVVDPHNAVLLDPDLGGLQKEQLDRLAQEFGAKQPHHESFIKPVNARFEIGYPLPGILSVAKESDVAMIVMGTLGATNFLDKIFGSVSSSVAQQAPCPVLVVPPEATFSKPRHLVVAMDDQLTQNGALEQLLVLNQDFKAHLDFVHVADENDQFELARDAVSEKILESRDLPFSFDIHEIARGTHVTEQLMKYARATNPDMLVLIARRRSFVERIFHKSVSKKLCLNTTRPTLILHTD